MKPPIEVLDIIKSKKSFLVFTHLSPDGDAFGSALALKFSLEQLDKKVELYSEHPIPVQYRFLPGIEFIKDINSLFIPNESCLILVDCNNPSRISNDKKIINKIKDFQGDKLVIDHHFEANTEYQSIKWIDPAQAATALMIYSLLKELNCTVTPEIATNLYTAIIVDTGNFQFENTDEEVLSIAAEFVKYGAKPSYIYQKSFESWSENRLKLFKKMLENVEIIPPLAIAFIRKNDFDETNTQEPDTERFAEFLRILKDVNISALIREIEKGMIKVSLRSKGDIDVSKIALEFEGGGHKNAAGYRITASIEEARIRLLEKLRVYN